MISLVSIKPNFLPFHSILGVEICPSFIEGCKKRPKGSHHIGVHIITMCASADGGWKDGMLGRSAIEGTVYSGLTINIRVILSTRSIYLSLRNAALLVHGFFQNLDFSRTSSTIYLVSLDERQFYREGGGRVHAVPLLHVIEPKKTGA
jgi:hypothetical protein